MSKQIIPIDRIAQSIYLLRGQKVMLSRSQIVTLERGQNIKYLPYASTEQGVAIWQLMVPAREPRREIGFHVRETAPRYRTRKLR